jgi:undecaprenyl phosphate-alpha-L-ara4FN deformylase
MQIGLRVDVDTLRGTRSGVPRLRQLFEGQGITASFFFSVGPDNMGRHLWRLLRPTFLLKMLRTRAASLYGWEILLRGLLWPGPDIGKRCAEQIRMTSLAGHEIGLHAWDHQRWQAKVASMTPHDLQQEMELGHQRLCELIGRQPDCAAAPGWRMTECALELRERFPYRYSSDCRGTGIFLPIIGDHTMTQPQIPSTLPTYDEMVGPTCSPADYYQVVLERVQPTGLNVLTVHAEVEGIVARDLFAQFLQQASQRGMHFVPLGTLLGKDPVTATAKVTRQSIPGRDSWLAVQNSQEKPK